MFIECHGVLTHFHRSHFDENYTCGVPGQHLKVPEDFQRSRDDTKATPHVARQQDNRVQEKPWDL